MPILNKKELHELKWNYNHNLNRYYNGCNYIEQNKQYTDKYLGELLSIKENLEILLTEIMENEKVSEEEILNGFKLECSTDEDEEEMIQTVGKAIKLMKKAKEICKESDTTYEFECPICGNNAYAGKSSINNHIHLKCEKCNISIMQ